jgi:23S rRNA pseudouridine1911/1915/1917 synthase
MRWTVRPGDGSTVREVLVRAGADVDAVRDGRVFVGRTRVRRDDERVRVGDAISIAPRREVGTEGAGEGLTFLAREGDLVAVAKPAGIPTIPDHGGSAHSLLARVASALGLDVGRVHPTSRLDRDVSGVVVFALSKAAGERLLRARAEGRYERRYLALAKQAPEVERGSWDAPIGRARDPKLRAVQGRDAVPASTRYAVTAVAPGGVAMLAVAPVTGRTHQIRVHSAHAGAPLLGDRAYGGPTRLTLPGGRVLEPGRIALHAARVVVPRGRGGEAGEPLVLSAPLPPELESLWSALGGEPAAWEVSLACDLSASS